MDKAMGSLFRENDRWLWKMLKMLDFTYRSTNYNYTEIVFHPHTSQTILQWMKLSVLKSYPYTVSSSPFSAILLNMDNQVLSDKEKKASLHERNEEVQN